MGYAYRHSTYTRALITPHFRRLKSSVSWHAATGRCYPRTQKADERDDLSRTTAMAVDSNGRPHDPRHLSKEFDRRPEQDPRVSMRDADLRKRFEAMVPQPSFNDFGTAFADLGKIPKTDSQSLPRDDEGIIPKQIDATDPILGVREP